VPSTRFLEKGDFVRLQNLTLAYDMPLSGEGVFKSWIMELIQIQQPLLLELTQNFKKHK